MTTFTDLPADIILLIFQIRPFPTNLNKQIYSIYKDSPHFDLFQRIPNFKSITLFLNNLAQYIHLDHPEIKRAHLRTVINKGHLESIKYSINSINNIGVQNLCNLYVINRSDAFKFGIKKSSPMIVSSDINLLFQFACFNGHVSVAEWILEREPSINISADDNFVFQTVCEYGHLSVAKLLFEQNPSSDISTNNDYAFRMACRNGHLPVAKWLLEQKPTIDISANNEEVFQQACMYGHLHIVKWLLEQKPSINISAYKKHPFRYVYVKGGLPILHLTHHTIPNIPEHIAHYYPPHIRDYLASL